MMWDSLKKLSSLPPETLVFSGHEYTSSNARFALTVEPGNAALRARSEEIDRLRAEGRPTVPVPLSVELETNPFLRADRPELRKALGMETEGDIEVFAEIRARKDRF